MTHSDIQRIQEAFAPGNSDFTAERPVEPTNINWHNMHIKKSEKIVRAGLVLMTIFGLLYVACF